MRLLLRRRNLILAGLASLAVLLLAACTPPPPVTTELVVHHDLPDGASSTVVVVAADDSVRIERAVSGTGTTTIAVAAGTYDLGATGFERPATEPGVVDLFAAQFTATRVDVATGQSLAVSLAFGRVASRPDAWLELDENDTAAIVEVTDTEVVFQNPSDQVATLARGDVLVVRPSAAGAALRLAWGLPEPQRVSRSSSAEFDSPYLTLVDPTCGTVPPDEVPTYRVVDEVRQDGDRYVVRTQAATMADTFRGTVEFDVACGLDSLGIKVDAIAEDLGVGAWSWLLPEAGIENLSARVRFRGTVIDAEGITVPEDWQPLYIGTGLCLAGVVCSHYLVIEELLFDVEGDDAGFAWRFQALEEATFARYLATPLPTPVPGLFLHFGFDLEAEARVGPLGVTFTGPLSIYLDYANALGDGARGGSNVDWDTGTGFGGAFSYTPQLELEIPTLTEPATIDGRIGIYPVVSLSLPYRIAEAYVRTGPELLLQGDLSDPTQVETAYPIEANVDWTGSFGVRYRYGSGYQDLVDLTGSTHLFGPFAHAKIGFENLGALATDAVVEWRAMDGGTWRSVGAGAAPFVLVGPGRAHEVRLVSLNSAGDRVALALGSGCVARSAGDRAAVFEGLDPLQVCRVSVGLASNAAPQVERFEVEPASPLEGETVTVRIEASDPDGDALSCSVAMGDGAVYAIDDCGAGPVAFGHAYGAAGSYTAALTATDPYGSEGRATFAVVVRVPPPEVGALALAVNGASGRVGAGVDVALFGDVGRTSQVATTTTGSDGVARFAGLNPQRYSYEVRNDPGFAAPGVTEYWGHGNADVVAGVTTDASFVRFMPYQTNRSITWDAQDGVFRATLTVVNGGSAIGTSVRLIGDRSRGGGYDLDATSGPVSIAGEGSHTFTWTLEPPAYGTYYWSFQVLAGAFGATDQNEPWDFAATASEPEPTAFGGVGFLAAGANHSLAIVDGAAYGWGANDDGELGDGSTANGNAPGAVATTAAFLAIDGGSNHTLALRTDGSLMAWGENESGELGTTAVCVAEGCFTTTPVVAADFTQVIDVSAGAGQSAAVRAYGNVFMWGRNYGVAPVMITGITDVIDVELGTNHALALTDVGEVWAWGSNGAGELGDGTFVDRSSPVRVSGLTGIVDIAAGESFSVAVASDGRVYTWGTNLLGQLGIGETGGNANLPERVIGLTDVVAVAAGYGHVVALRETGHVVAWGYNGRGQLGIGTTTNVDLPNYVPGVDGAVQLVAGTNHSLARMPDGTVRAWGRNHLGQLGDGTFDGPRTSAVIVVP